MRNKPNKKYIVCARFEDDNIIVFKANLSLGYSCGYAFFKGEIEELKDADFWDNPELLSNYLIKSHNGAEYIKRDAVRKIRKLYKKGNRPRVFLWSENEVIKQIALNAS